MQLFDRPQNRLFFNTSIAQPFYIFWVDFDFSVNADAHNGVWEKRVCARIFSSSSSSNQVHWVLRVQKVHKTYCTKKASSTKCLEDSCTFFIEAAIQWKRLLLFSWKSHLFSLYVCIICQGITAPFKGLDELSPSPNMYIQIFLAFYTKLFYEFRYWTC